MSEEERLPWFDLLYELLQSETTDEEIIEFVEDHVPTEGRILDYKSDMYLSANSSHHQNRRESELIKYFSAFSNVIHPSSRRYLFIGFNNDGEFEGIQYRGQQGGDHIVDVDVVRIENILDPENVYPVPDFEFFELEKDGDRGGVIVIEREDQPPVVVQNTYRASDGSEFIASGQAYTRDGSQTVLMDNSDFRDLIESRERLINEKLEEMSDSLGRVVGISSEQLAEMDLTVSPRDEGIPIEEFLTTDPVSGSNEKLISLVKTWNSTGDLISARRILYDLYSDREELDLTDEKAEFLFRSSLNKYLTGAEWLIRYEGDTDDLFERVMEEDNNDESIRNLEHILLILQEEDYLQEIVDDGNIDYSRSKASSYVGKCGDALLDRVCAYARPTIKYGGSQYRVSDLLEDPDTADDLLDEVVEDLIQNDTGVRRGVLRQVELVRLGATVA